MRLYYLPLIWTTLGLIAFVIDVACHSNYFTVHRRRKQVKR
jgi:hypothetical protein